MANKCLKFSFQTSSLALVWNSEKKGCNSLKYSSLNGGIIRGWKRNPSAANGGLWLVSMVSRFLREGFSGLRSKNFGHSKAITLTSGMFRCIWATSWHSWTWWRTSASCRPGGARSGSPPRTAWRSASSGSSGRWPPQLGKLTRLESKHLKGQINQSIRKAALTYRDWDRRKIWIFQIISASVVIFAWLWLNHLYLGQNVWCFSKKKLSYD